MQHIQIAPSHLSYGCVSQGFVYNLSVTIINKSPKPQSVKIMVDPLTTNPAAEDKLNRIKVNFVPIKIAPGVKQSFSLDLYAEHVGNSIFELTVEQSMNRFKYTKQIKALIVPVDVFKHVAKSLRLQKRPIYRNGIVVVGAIGTTDDSRSIVTSGGASVLSDAIMDDADLQELAEIPLVQGLFFDHHKGKLCFDSKSCEVVVGHLSLDESIEQTKKMREDRIHKLEELGFHTEHSIKNASLSDKTRHKNIGLTNENESSNVLENESRLGSPMTFDAGGDLSSILGSTLVD